MRNLLEARSRQSRRVAVVALVPLVMVLTGCGIFDEVSVAALDAALPNTLAGAQGHKESDQDAIDDMVAALCTGKVYEPERCDEHTIASAERFRELIQ